MADRDSLILYKLSAGELQEANSLRLAVLEQRASGTYAVGFITLSVRTITNVELTNVSDNVDVPEWNVCVTFIRTPAE